MSARDFWDLGLQYANKSVNGSKITLNRSFRSCYGVSPDVCYVLWSLIEQQHFAMKPKHLLWTLFFLKCYNTEAINASMFKTDEKTYRLWVWRLIESLANLEVVSYLNTFKYFLKSIG